MKTKKLLFTILITCISFMGISKSNDPLLAIEVEDDRIDAHCAAYIPHILGPSSPLCLNNKYTFKWPHEGPNWSLFLHYEWELVDKYGVTVKKGTTTQPYAILYLNNFTVTQIRVRSVHGYLNDILNHCKGPWVTLPIKIVRGAIPITSITSEGSFCQGSSVRFTASPTSNTHNGAAAKYKWEIYFGPVTPATTISTQNNQTPWISVPSGINGYSGTDPIDVFVTPVNKTCGDGPEYHQVITPAPTFTPFVKGIVKPIIYCSGKSNVFKVSNPMVGTEYKWTIERYYSNSPSSIGNLTLQTGFEMYEITSDFGSGNPVGAGTVVKYRIKLQGRSGCAQWSNPISTGMVYVTYGNCNYIPNIASSSNNNAKTGVFDMNIYPNPSSSGIFNINVSGLEGDKTIEVHDVYGKFIFEDILRNAESKLDLSRYSRGLYFVKISNEVYQKTQRIIF